MASIRCWGQECFAPVFKEVHLAPGPAWGLNMSEPLLSITAWGSRNPVQAEVEGLTQGQPKAREWLEDPIHLYTKGHLLGKSVVGGSSESSSFGLALESCLCKLGHLLSCLWVPDSLNTPGHESLCGVWGFSDPGLSVPQFPMG